MARHARKPEPPLPPQAGHRAASHRRRPRADSGAARTVLAVCCTALAAGTGGILTGALPGPAGFAGSIVTADDPALPHGADGGDAAAAPATGQAAGRTRVPAARSPSAPGRDQGSSDGPSASASPSARLPRAAVPRQRTSSPAASSADTGTATPQPTGQPLPSTSATTAAAQVLSLVNQARATAGCGPLTADGPLDSLATAFSDDMATRDFFDNTDPDGRTPWDRAKLAGIDYLGGENIARGQQTAQEVMDAWMDSPDHRANILDCDYHRLGVGFHEGPDGPWWTQDFGF